jgi:hypothetical protein
MIPMPSSVTQQIARRAVEIIQTTAPKKTGKAVNSILPEWQDGIVGIEIPQEAAYLFDLDRGVSSKTMINLTGRVIPIREPDGTIAFRKINSSSVGRIPIIMRAAEDGQISDGNAMWVQPSKPGLAFIEKSIERSIDEWERTVKPDDIIKILQQTKLKGYIDAILAGNRGIVGI